MINVLPLSITFTIATSHDQNGRVIPATRRHETMQALESDIAGIAGGFTRADTFGADPVAAGNGAKGETGRAYTVACRPAEVPELLGAFYRALIGLDQDSGFLSVIGDLGRLPGVIFSAMPQDADEQAQLTRLIQACAA